MRKLFRRIAMFLGVRTWYHVSATYNKDSHVGTHTISLTCYGTPWIHIDNYGELVTYVGELAGAKSVTITNITRLGP